MIKIERYLNRTHNLFSTYSLHSHFTINSNWHDTPYQDMYRPYLPFKGKILESRPPPWPSHDLDNIFTLLSCMTSTSCTPFKHMIMPFPLPFPPSYDITHTFLYLTLHFAVVIFIISLSMLSLLSHVSLISPIIIYITFILSLTFYICHCYHYHFHIIISLLVPLFTCCHYYQNIPKSLLLFVDHIRSILHV